MKEIKQITDPKISMERAYYTLFGKTNSIFYVYNCNEKCPGHHDKETGEYIHSRYCENGRTKSRKLEPKNGYELLSDVSRFLGLWYIKYYIIDERRSNHKMFDSAVAELPRYDFFVKKDTVIYYKHENGKYVKSLDIYNMLMKLLDKKCFHMILPRPTGLNWDDKIEVGDFA